MSRVGREPMAELRRRLERGGKPDVIIRRDLIAALVGDIDDQAEEIKRMRRADAPMLAYYRDLRDWFAMVLIASGGSISISDRDVAAFDRDCEIVRVGGGGTLTTFIVADCDTSQEGNDGTR